MKSKGMYPVKKSQAKNKAVKKPEKAGSGKGVRAFFSRMGKKK